MSSRNLLKPKVKRVIRAIIMGAGPDGDQEFLLFQRSKGALRYPNIWECIGGALDPRADQKAIHTLLRECSEEAGIRVSRIIKEVHNEKREWEPVGDRDERYDFYHVTHYLVETPTIKEVLIGQEHRGFGWFTGPHVGIMRRVMRNSSYDAIRIIHHLSLAELDSIMHVNPRHR